MEIKDTILDFDRVNKINVNDYVEKKNGLTYLSWSLAWQAFCREYPRATYSIKKDEQGNAFFGNSTNGYMVYTSVTVDGLTHEMWLPVMDFKNKSMLNPTTFDVNKAIMRCLTKNLAMFGLGLYIYAGEDLPDEVDTSVTIMSRPSSGMKRNDGIAWLKSQTESIRNGYLARYNKDKGKSITDVTYMAGDWIEKVSAEDKWK